MKKEDKEIIERGLIVEEEGIPEKKIVLMDKFSPVPYAKEIMRETKFVYDKYKRFWRYDYINNVWREDAPEWIKRRLRISLLGDEQQKKHYTEEIVSYIRDLSYREDIDFELDKNLIPFQNFMYDLETGELIEYSPDYPVTLKIPVAINPLHKECPKIDKFFSDIVGEDYKIMLYELCAYCLYRDYPYQKIFFLYGQGANGKSTFLELLRRFLGTYNVSNVSPHDIMTNRFALGSMWNKLANISSDISYEVLKNINKLKEITGGDSVSIERKYKESFQARIFAKQIFATNQLPIVEDKTLAFYRRIYLIFFPNVFNEPDRAILDKLTTPEELSGLAWKCLEVLKDMKDRGFCFTYDPIPEKIAELYEDMSNPLAKFIKDECEEDGDGIIFKFEFNQRFREWLKTNKIRIWSDTEIGRMMKKMGYEETKSKYYAPDGSHKWYRAWVGLKWREDFSDFSKISNYFKTFSYIYRKVLKYPEKLEKSEKLDVESEINRTSEQQQPIKLNPPCHDTYEIFPTAYQVVKGMDGMDFIEFMIIKNGKAEPFKAKVGDIIFFNQLGDEKLKIINILLNEHYVEPI